jgi:hypothetical protein
VAGDEPVIQTLKNASSSIFTEDNTSTIILANGVTIDELNKEKSKTIEIKKKELEKQI